MNKRAAHENLFLPEQLAYFQHFIFDIKMKGNGKYRSTQILKDIKSIRQILH